MRIAFMFRAAKQSRIFQDVVDQIQESILSGELSPGDMLPAERELKEMLQVSRGTLREALRVLEQKGLIEIKLGVGGGAVVKEATFDQVGESLALLIRCQKISLNHLAEFRVGVEGDAAALAAGRAGRSDIEQLKALIDQARACIETSPPDTKAFIDIDKKVHLTLACLSQNPVYVSLHHTVHDNIDRYYERFLVMQQRELQENFQDLCDIVLAVEQGRAEAARDLARRHVLRFNHYMEKKIAQ
jgi:DNA-binding FadR family transcriptional regulator